MSDTPLRLASLREIAEELIRREQGGAVPEAAVTPDARAADKPIGGVRRGPDKHAAKERG